MVAILSTSVLLDLSRHCIETAARHAERERVTRLLHGGGRREAQRDELDETSQRQLELLQEFLRTADFAALRAEHSALRGGTIATVQLERTASGTVQWSLRTLG